MKEINAVIEIEVITIFACLLLSIFFKLTDTKVPFKFYLHYNLIILFITACVIFIIEPLLNYLKL